MTAEHRSVNESSPLTAMGERVFVRPVERADLEGYPRALALSARRIKHWNPIDPGDLEMHLRFQSTGHRTFVIHAIEPAPEAGHDLVGVVNVTSVVRGRAMSGNLGYNAYDPYAGGGLFSAGMRLVVDLVFEPEPHGMGLHRIEAAVQPGNVRSAGLLRSLGFRRRAEWPNYMWLGDADGHNAWRDHVTYGLVAEEWPAQPWALPKRERPVVVVGPGWGSAAARLATELGVSYVPAAVVEALDPLEPADTRDTGGAAGAGNANHSDARGVRPLEALLAGSSGAVLELPRPIDAPTVSRLLEMLQRTGIHHRFEFTLAGDEPPGGEREIVALALDVHRSAARAR